ncbi:MAG: L-2-hydroxyglutarate oxidase [Legionellaceae bacterium]|nr:L-2-hydroxyglutarate oxidase [Legionellaceae bacterium]
MHVDFIIIGAGILGLSVARELKMQYPKAKIAIIEKESEIGLHASGRNSGIMHAGIYYKSDSLKAKFCLNGARAMMAYCDEHNLPIDRIGKIILPTKSSDEGMINTLYKRAQSNGTSVELIDNDELRRMEPLANIAAKTALFSPETSVVSPKAILQHLKDSLVAQGVDFYFNSLCTNFLTKQKKIFIDGEEFSYGHLFNTAGLYADKVAYACGLQDKYTMIPFKGMYYELAKSSKININHLIYPVPDMNVPFLGVHFTKSIDGKIYIGPTAIPVLGREHYKGVKGIKFSESIDVFSQLGQQYLTNKQGFRNYAHQEIPRFLKSRFIDSAKAMVNSISASDLVKSKKVGIRAQLFDKQKHELAMDFIVGSTANETHVLNAVSPAFTSSFSFSKYVVDKAQSPSLVGA